MKNSLLSILVCLFYNHTIAQQDNKVTIGTIDSIQSKILNEQRTVWVHVPNSSSNGAYSRQRYPVVYLLDGDKHFYSVVGMLQHFAHNAICPDMMVVGILNTDRTRDLVPTVAGGKFLSFIENELVPYVDANYPTQSYKMLIGHSYGGLTVMNSLINHTNLFNSYICIDPSMTWNKLKFLEVVKDSLTTKSFPGRTLYLGIANTMDESIDITKVPSDTSSNTRGIRYILDMDTHIKSKKPGELKYASRYYENEGHESVPLLTIYDGFRFIFEKFLYKVTSKDFIDPSPTALADKVNKHFEAVCNLMGFQVKPPEDLVNFLAYLFLGMKRFDHAANFFKMNVVNYPENYKAYNSYGDYFVAIGDKTKAIENFRKSLSLKEIAGTRKKLDGLLK